VLHVDVSRGAALSLAFGDDVLAERGLTGRFGTVDLGDAGFGNAADAQSHVEREGAGWNGFHLHMVGFAKAHDAAITVFFDDIV